MSLKTVTVQCPWCQHDISVQIEAEFTRAKAIPTGGNLPKDKGIDLPCPNCPHQLFIRFEK